MCVHWKEGEIKGRGWAFIYLFILLTHRCLEPMSDTQSMKYGKVERRKRDEVRSLPGHPRIERG